MTGRDIPDDAPPGSIWEAKKRFRFEQEAQGYY